jgi:hypothetical protein
MVKNAFISSSFFLWAVWVYVLGKGFCKCSRFRDWVSQLNRSAQGTNYVWGFRL